MQTRKNLNQVLLSLPQIENQLTETQSQILAYLKTKRIPTLPRTISKDLNLDYNSTRARLFELVSMGYVCQPNKAKLSMSQLDDTGKTKYDHSVKKCGYAAIKLGN